LRAANAPVVPSGLKKRYANAYLVSNPLVRRKFYVGTLAIYQSLQAPGATITSEDYPGANDAAAGNLGLWNVTSLRGEKTRKPVAITAPDTGLTDGTSTQ
jgi:hypothetical protein